VGLFDDSGKTHSESAMTDREQSESISVGHASSKPGIAGNRFEILVILINGLILLPPVRAALVAPYSLGLGITSFLFGLGLWLMRYEVAQSFGDMLKGLEQSETGWLGGWLQLSHYFGTLILGALIGGLGFISAIMGVRHLFTGVPADELTRPDWMILPALIFAFGVGLLMWGFHLRPEKVRDRIAANLENGVPGPIWIR
jgi:hypothetical protein